MQDDTGQDATIAAAPAFAEAFERLRRLSRSEPAPVIDVRRRLLRAVRSCVAEGQSEFAAAISQDFGQRSRRETLMCEVVPSLQSTDDALRHLAAWMRPKRKWTAPHFWPAGNRVLFQPKGVVLIIAPWNYPLQLTIAPLVAALAAGNRVVVKPSELTPRFADVLKRRLEAALGTDYVHVVTGGAEVAAALTALPFDHILFTGSTAVGRKVMQAAARNLTPVTLELGGKSPAIVYEDFDFATASRRIARGKLMNAGQTCIAPDYVLAPAGRVQEFIDHYRAEAARLYPRLAANPDYTSIASLRHYTRLAELVVEARKSGAEITVIDPAGEFPKGEIGSADSRKMAPVVVSGAGDATRIMQEEIFGPLLAVVPYTTLDAAIRYVNDRPRPLALYYFDADKTRVKDLLARTVSGGASVNDTIFHVAQESIPFGGIGPSGMGAYHGRAGFETFSHAKGVFHQSRFAGTELLNPPYGRVFDKAIAALTWWLGGK